MRRWLVTLAVLAMVSGLATPALAQDIAAMSFEQLTVAGAEKNFTATTVNVGGKAAARCVGVLETAEIRIRVDGTAASATVGQVVPVGATVDIRGVDNVRRFSAWRTGVTSGVLPMTCYPAPADTVTYNFVGVSPTPAASTAGLSADGTAALPSIAFSGDTNTGRYRIGADNVGESAGGTLRFDWNTERILSTIPFLFTDNTVDIGASGATRPRTGYFGTSVIAPVGTFATSATSAIVDATATIRVGGVVTVAATPPTVASGFGTTPSIVASNGTAAFTVNVGTGGIASEGVLTLPTATTGWACMVVNRTAVFGNVANAHTVQIATTTTSVTLENQTISTGAALAWTASDVLQVSCVAY